MASPQLEKGHTRIANEVLEKLAEYPLSGNQSRIVLWVIRNSWGWHGQKLTTETRSCYIAEKIRMAKSSAHLAASELVRARILYTNTNRWGFNKDHESWVWPAGSKNPAHWISSPLDVQPTGFSVQPTGRLIRSKEKKENKEMRHFGNGAYSERSGQAKKTTLLETFNAFYSAYPRHKDKARAWRCWKALNPSYELVSRIGAALDSDKASDEWSNPRWIPYPATWIDDRRWEDEASEQKATGGKAARQCSECGNPALPEAAMCREHAYCSVCDDAGRASVKDPKDLKPMKGGRGYICTACAGRK